MIMSFVFISVYMIYSNKSNLLIWLPQAIRNDERIDANGYGATDLNNPRSIQFTQAIFDIFRVLRSFFN